MAWCVISRFLFISRFLLNVHFTFSSWSLAQSLPLKNSPLFLPQVFRGVLGCGQAPSCLLIVIPTHALPTPHPHRFLLLSRMVLLKHITGHFTHCLLLFPVAIMCLGDPGDWFNTLLVSFLNFLILFEHGVPHFCLLRGFENDVAGPPVAIIYSHYTYPSYLST